MKKIFVFAFFLSVFLNHNLAAQKFGFCNSVALLAELPEVKQADSDLQAYQSQLTKQGQQMVQSLQTKAQDLQVRKEKGTISPKDEADLSAKLQEEQTKIQEFEQKVYADLSKRKEETYSPILKKVNDALATVAVENGFTLVFDQSTQILMYAHESLDVTKLVKAKLGIL